PRQAAERSLIRSPFTSHKHRDTSGSGRKNLRMRQNKGKSRGLVVKAVGRFAPVLCGMSLVPTLAGCILGTERPDIALDIPGAYRAGGRAPEAALPKLD